MAVSLPGSEVCEKSEARSFTWITGGLISQTYPRFDVILRTNCSGISENSCADGNLQAAPSRKIFLLPESCTLQHRNPGSRKFTNPLISRELESHPSGSNPALICP